MTINQKRGLTTAALCLCLASPPVLGDPDHDKAEARSKGGKAQVIKKKGLLRDKTVARAKGYGTVRIKDRYGKTIAAAKGTNPTAKKVTGLLGRTRIEARAGSYYDRRGRLRRGEAVARGIR